MARSDEWRGFIREAVREIEMARGEVLEERRAKEEAKWEEHRAKDQEHFHEEMNTLFSGGPQGDPCPICEGEMRARWKHCPRCGHPADNTCLFCHEWIPK